MRAFFTAGLWSNESCHTNVCTWNVLTLPRRLKCTLGYPLFMEGRSTPAFDSLATRIKAINPTNATEITDLVKSLIPSNCLPVFHLKHDDTGGDTGTCEARPGAQRGVVTGLPCIVVSQLCVVLCVECARRIHAAAATAGIRPTGCN